MMNQRDIFRKVGSILTELNEQYEFLARNPEKLNHLEVELFLANADFLADHVRVVKKLNPDETADKHIETDSAHLLNQQNTIILPEVKSYKEAEECFDPVELPEVITAEEEEARVDIQPEQEVFDEEKIQQETADDILHKDFFKPDQEENTFEFVLGNHNVDDKFDYEQKSVDEIFDRPLSKAEEEILAQKKRIQEKDEQQENEPLAADDDEMGPEPFLLPHEEQVETRPMVETLFNQVEETPVEIVKPVEYDEPIIAPAVEDRPAFIPQAVPVKPTPPVEDAKAPTLNDLLAKTNQQPQEPSKAPVADLKQVINLNEKLLFIKDLFGGYNLAYSEAIDIVNKMPNFESADSFLQNNYAGKNNWAAKQATVDQFYELLNRRFGA
ncbi:hypothetical protein QWY86_06690 [Pedobacter aquatilis]|uniref:hypothetical protein n=1 Tax=Pedobacter aquatilis TaxID=351343 RepID=UPI0025B3B163|nr:hypothetical protein [Pedobacter aquatilis]MDN3586346.1 hypothetical protein [Pedobacter aquatilis]